MPKNNSKDRINNDVDIAEDDFIKKDSGILNLLLKDNTTKKNIFWATDNYVKLGESYKYFSQISESLITGLNNKIIMPRVLKNKDLQLSRVKDMAEVYTPAWICNAQNNLVDNAWFERKDVFNTELQNNNRTIKWVTNYSKVLFPKGKNFMDYVKDIRIEIACGEAPYITSRYDTTTGEFIPVKDRIGILDRKLRVINENVKLENEWVSAAEIAYKSTYAYEWQGDSLLLAREAMLYTFIENYKFMFNKGPMIGVIKNIAYIISWNVWQMDGLKFVVPSSCSNVEEADLNLHEERKIISKKCEACKKDDNSAKHNGIYCRIMDWEANNGNGKEIEFVQLFNNKSI